MDAKPLPPRPNLEQYKKQAKDLLKACKSDDPNAIRTWAAEWTEDVNRLEENLRSKLPKSLSDAQFFIARAHAFDSWPRLAKHVEALARQNSADSKFESAVDAVVSGDMATLRRLLRENPELIRARSNRQHRSTLLHYVSANGVEDFRQKTPPNAVEVAKVLLDAGAEVDAESDAYGRGTTLGLAATSIHPAHAGVQIALMETLLDAGASVDGAPGEWNPLIAALHNGRPKAADYLARHGARLDLEGAAGVGRLDLVKSLFNDAPKKQIELGFMWACEFGQTAVVEFLLDKGRDVGTQVDGMTGLHWAVVGGHLETIQLLVKRNAPLDVRNRYGGTPLGQVAWAITHSDPVYRWPDTETDWEAIVKTLTDAGAD